MWRTLDMPIREGGVEFVWRRWGCEEGEVEEAEFGRWAERWLSRERPGIISVISSRETKSKEWKWSAARSYSCSPAGRHMSINLKKLRHCWSSLSLICILLSQRLLWVSTVTSRETPTPLYNGTIIIIVRSEFSACIHANFPDIILQMYLPSFQHRKSERVLFSEADYLKFRWYMLAILKVQRFREKRVRFVMISHWMLLIEH